MSIGGYTTYLLQTTPALYCARAFGTPANPRGVAEYRPVFGPLRAYGELLGLAPPSLEEGVFAKGTARCPFWPNNPNHPSCDIVAFSPAFVTFVAKLHDFLMEHGEDYIMPCVFKDLSCDDYECFDGRPRVCDDTGHVHCESGRGIVSVQIMKKRSWVEALLAAVALSHNLELAASAFVVVLVVFVCLRGKDRDELHIDFAEMGAIIQEQKKTLSAEGLEAHKSRADALEKQVAALKQEMETMKAEQSSIKDEMAKRRDKA
jgi:hypothetical protein